MRDFTGKSSRNEWYTHSALFIWPEVALLVCIYRKLAILCCWYKQCTSMNCRCSSAVVLTRPIHFPFLRFLCCPFACNGSSYLTFRHPPSHLHLPKPSFTIPSAMLITSLLQKMPSIPPMHLRKELLWAAKFFHGKMLMSWTLMHFCLVRSGNEVGVKWVWSSSDILFWKNDGS